MSEQTIFSEVVAASLGGAVSASILYPLEVLKTKMQAVGSADDDEKENGDSQQSGPAVKKLSMVPFAVKLYRTQGVEVFFRGVETSAFQSALEKALYFFAYTTLKEMHAMVSGGAKLDTLTNLALGCAAEWAHLPISLPVDAWTTKIQTSNEAPMKILFAMLSDKDQNFYKGLSAYYLLCFKPALQYTVYEQMKAIMVQNRKEQKLGSVEAFLLGMFARTVATVLVFPFLRAKVLMQAQKTKERKQTEEGPVAEVETNRNVAKGSLGVLMDQWRSGGVSGLYQGLGPELTRGIFSAALMLMIKERLAELVQATFSSKKKLRGRR